MSVAKGHSTIAQNYFIHTFIGINWVITLGGGLGKSTTGVRNFNLQMN
jgi:hypothetical protein